MGDRRLGTLAGKRSRVSSGSRPPGPNPARARKTPEPARDSGVSISGAPYRIRVFAGANPQLRAPSRPRTLAGKRSRVSSGSRPPGPNPARARKTPEPARDSGVSISGAPYRIRTYGLGIRSPLLYPAELTARRCDYRRKRGVGTKTNRWMRRSGRPISERAIFFQFIILATKFTSNESRVRRGVLYDA